MQLVTFSAVRAVPGFDGGRASDEGEIWEGSKVRVALGDEAVGAVGAGDGCEGGGALIVSLVVGDGDGLGCCCLG